MYLIDEDSEIAKLYQIFMPLATEFGLDIGIVVKVILLALAD